MRVPLSWLRNYVDLPEQATPEDVLAALVRVGFEEEDVHGFDVRGPVVAGQVLSFEEEPQSNGKTIRWCQVDVGADNGGVRGIVCGANNFAPGDKVAVTLPGAVLPGGFEIAARKTYGHISDGMMASLRELGLGDDHAGIFRFADWELDPSVGVDAISILGLDQQAVEINVTPDRGYALSMRGVAREYSHATGAVFRDPIVSRWHEPGEGFSVTIDDRAPIRDQPAARLIVFRTVTGVDASRPTPSWMRTRLILAGVRPISLLVDITNYVMLETGQPLHGYDADTVVSGITVRRAAAGEKLVTLDGAERALNPEDIVIADGDGPIALAGVMGGQRTEMTDTTHTVLLEAGLFDPVSVGRSSRRHKLVTDASRRFERNVDPHALAHAAQRAADLLCELAGGTDGALGGFAGTREHYFAPVMLPQSFVSELVGVEYAPQEITEVLERIGCHVTADDESWQVTPPSWRPDLTDRWTLAEEVVRIHGLDRVPSILPTAPAGRGWTASQQTRRRIADALAAAGFHETLSFPFISPERNALYGSADAAPQAAVTLANPLDATEAQLRRSLIPGMLRAAHRNQARGVLDLALFETGTVFLPEQSVSYGTDTVPPTAVRPDDHTVEALDASVPPQPKHLGLLLTGVAHPKQPGHAAEDAELVDALSAIDVIATATGVPITVTPGRRAVLHPGRTGVLYAGEQEIGYIGEVLPRHAADENLAGRVIVAELNLEALMGLMPDHVTAQPFSTFPAATQDVSVIVPAEISAAEVKQALIDGCGQLLESLWLVDEYRGAGVAEGQKSLSYFLRFRAPDRTLSATEATEAKMAGVAVASERYGAIMRE